ncbi:MAG: GDP-mannose 4,6-dehydratase [Candidatus Dormibacteraeota bacterium]|nr:GDP-mannose 4,6-dehydratase [Candidatus Dormibacteraeota bacterium]
MRVLATGGAGFIGSHLADALLKRGDEVIVIDDLSTGSSQNLNPDAEFHQLDIRSRQAAELVRRRRPDAIVHHAAQMSVSRSVREPAFDADVNLMGSINLLEAARQAEARFIFASTGGALYGDADILPTPETYPAWPVSPYGVSKLAFEHYLHCYGVQHGLGYTALRYANVFGPRQNPHGEAGVVAIFCLNLLSAEPPTVNGDGQQTRDFIHVADVVRANLAALDSDQRGHFNVGTGRPCDINTLFEMNEGRMEVSIGKRHGPARPGDQRTSVLDSSLIADKLGWQPEMSLEAGVADTVDWFRRSQVPL